MRDQPGPEKTGLIASTSDGSKRMDEAGVKQNTELRSGSKTGLAVSIRLIGYNPQMHKVHSWYFLWHVSPVLLPTQVRVSALLLACAA